MNFNKNEFMSEETNKEPITGYFSASKEENLTEGTLVPTGRSGVYHEKNTLISIINAITLYDLSPF